MTHQPPDQPAIRAPRRGGRWLACGVGALAIVGVTGFILWHYAAPRLPAEWVRDRIIGAIQSATGGRANVALSSARIRRSEAGPRLVLDGFALQDGQGRPMIGAPRAEIGFDLWSLVFGGGAVRRVELHDVEVKLALDRGGRIALTSGSDDAPAAAGDWRALLGSLAGVLSGQEPALAGLDRLALRNGRLVIDDPHHGGRVRYDDISIDLDTAAPVRRLTVSARGAERPWSLDVVRSSADALDIDARGISLADIGALLRLPIDARAGAPMSGRIKIALRDDGAPHRVAVDVRAHEGQLVLAPGSPREMVLTELALKASWDAKDSAVAVERLAWRTPTMNAEFAVAIRPDGKGGWDIEASEGSGAVRAVRVDNQFIPFKGATLKANWGVSGDIALSHWRFGGEDFEFKGDARISHDLAAEPTLLQLSATASDANIVLSYWPAWVATDARNYLLWALEKGRVDRFDVKARIDAEARSMFERWGVVPREALSVDVAMSNARMLVQNGFPMVDIENAVGRADGRYVSVSAPRASVETPARRRAHFTDLEFFAEYADEIGPSRIEFRHKGPAEPVFDLFETPLMKTIADIGDEIDVTKGLAEFRAHLAFPLNTRPKITDVQMSASGTVSGLTIEGATPDDPLTDVKGTLSLERGQFAMKGDGRLVGAPTGIDVRRAANGTGEAVLSVTLDDAARARKGLPSGPLVTGPIQVKMTRTLGGAKERPARVEADLARASINGLVPGWVKPAGRPGKVQFSYAPSTRNADVELQDFTAESAGFLLRGAVTLGPNSALRAAKFSQARMSPGDDVRLEWEKTGNLTKLVIRGANLDARPLLKNIYNPSRDGAPDAQDIDIDLRAAIFTGYNGEAATNVEMKASRRGAELRQLQVSGKFGRADLRAQLTRRSEGPPRVQVETADAGAFLRFIDLYRRMIGGRLTIDTTANDGRQDGQLVVNDFILRNEPALRRAGEAPAAAAPADDNARIARPRAVATAQGDVAFEKVRVDFVRSSGRIDIKDGVMWGALLGVQFEGIIDAPRDRIEVTGTYVPAYALNNAFAQVPVVGLILGGGQHGGLFGVNFKVSGAFAAPAVMVNPLSAITPGVFRRFLEFNKQSVEGRAQVSPRDLATPRQQ